MRCALLLLALALARPAAADEERNDAGAPIPGDVTATPSELEVVPAFPGARALRFGFDADLLPTASLEGSGGAVGAYRPGLRARVAVPLTSRAALQLVTAYGITLYDFDRAPAFFGEPAPPADAPFGDLHDVRVNLQGAYQLNRERALLFEGERWSLLAEVFGSARWEDDAFGNGVFGGGGLALGYELGGRLKLAVGVGLRSRFAEDGIDVVPVLSGSLRLTDALTLRSRSRGGQLEYRWSDDLTVYGSVFRTGQSWRLDRRDDLRSRLVLSDTQWRCGLGAEWRVRRQLRLQLEVGAVAWREIEVEERGSEDRTLARVEARPSAYLALSVQLRP